MKGVYEELRNRIKRDIKVTVRVKKKKILNVFLIKVKRIIFHSWKLSSCNFLTREHCQLIVFDFSSFFNLSYWKSLQMVSYFTFVEDEFHKNYFCICGNACIILFGITTLWVKEIIFLQIVTLLSFKAPISVTSHLDRFGFKPVKNEK